MAVTVKTVLNFEAEEQSLWSPGGSVLAELDTEDLMVWNPAKVVENIDIGGWVAGFEGDFYLDMAFGLKAYASLGSSGSFETEMGFTINAQVPAGVDITQEGPNPEAPRHMKFDFTDWDYGKASVETEGFGLGGKAGLKLVIGLMAGMENMSYQIFGDEEQLDDWSLIDISKEGPSKEPYEFTLIEVSQEIPGLEVPLGPEGTILSNITLVANLPEGADIDEESEDGQGNGFIEGEGNSDDPFLGLEADLGGLLTDFMMMIPPLIPVARVLKVILTEQEFDLHDLIAAVDEGKIVLSATLLKITASVGLFVHEEVSVDARGADDVPDVRITLRSDNGTPTDFSDDIMRRGWMGGEPMYIPQPVAGTFDPVEGFITVNGYFDLQNVEFWHGIGVQANAGFNITALQAELGGDWIPDFLAVSFGPVLDKDFPEDGFELGTIDIWDDEFMMRSGDFLNASSGTDPATWRYREGAFKQIQKDYKVFFTNFAPNNWNPDAPNAQAVAAEFRDLALANINAAISQYEFLWADYPAQVIVGRAFTLGNDVLRPITQHTSYLWLGDVDLTLDFVNQGGSDGNYVIVTPTSEPGPLRVNLGRFTNDSGTPTLLANAVGVQDATSVQMQQLLGFLYQPFDDEADSVIYETGSGNSLQRLISDIPVDVIGLGASDILLYLPEKGIRGQQHLFDGGTSVAGAVDTAQTYDIFVANFLATDRSTKIEWDLAAAVQSGAGVDLAGDNPVTVRNVEAMWLITGDKDDSIVTYAFNDWLETSAGNDYIGNWGDLYPDMINAGADNDLIINWVQDAPGTNHATVADTILGGTGNDWTFHVQTSNQPLRVDLFFSGGYFIGGNGLGADSGLAQLSDLAILHSSIFADVQLGAPIRNGVMDAWRERKSGSGSDAVVYLNNSEAQGATRYAEDIEGIAVEGSDTANDLVLFTGGPLYVGGTGPGSQADTLVGDFRTWAALLGIQGGLHIDAGTDSYFGNDILISGFERFVVIATDENDAVRGGTQGDWITAEDGDDLLWGGNDTVRDVLKGGRGDDTFLWSNDGPDIIRGDDSLQDAFDFTNVDTLFISADGTETHGLYYDLHTLVHGDAELTGGVGTDAAPFPYYSYAQDGAVLLQGLDLFIAARADTDIARAVSFGGTSNDQFATYWGIEQVSVRASNAFDDLLFYEDGATYEAGERPDDIDVFVADFSDDRIGMDFRVDDEDTTGQLMTNGVFIKGVDRVVMRTGQGNDTLVGGKWADTFETGDGDDHIMGLGGADTIHAGAGNDWVTWMADGWDWVYGDAGDDNLVVTGGAGNPVTLLDLGVFNNTGGAERVNAGSLLDTMALMVNRPYAASPGIRQSIFSGESESLTYSGFEHVNVAGTDGFDDFILYQDGSAYVGGERAGDADVFAGYFGSFTQDLLFDVDRIDATGQAASYDIGNGTYIHGFERLVVTLGTGDDIAIGGMRGDHLAGGEGRDYLDAGATGGSVRDNLFGGAGDDVLFFTSGQSQFDGGQGYDTVYLDGLGGNVNVAVWDTNFGGVPSLSVAQGDTRAELVTLFAALPESDRFNYYTAGTSTVFITDAEEINIVAGDGSDALVAGQGSGHLYAGGGNDLLVSRHGDDLLIGAGGSDIYAFGTNFGNDVIGGETAGGATLYFVGQALASLTFSAVDNDLRIAAAAGGTVTVVGYFNGGGNGLNFVFDTSDFNGTRDLTGLGAPGGGNTTAGAVVPGGADEDDLYSSGAGADTFFGYAGSDFLRSSPGPDVFIGGRGRDMVSYGELPGGVTVNLQSGRAFGGDAQGDLLQGIEDVVGGLGASSLTGDIHDNALVGGPANDTLVGAAGEDLLAGGRGADSVDGGANDDTLIGDSGNDTLLGGDGDDSLLGGDGDDSVRGGAHADALTGGAGNDTLLGDAGDDILVYGGNEDTATGGVHEDGLDSLDGGADSDAATFSLFGAAVSADLRSGFNIAQTRDGTDMLPATGTLRTIATLANIESLIGTDFSDILIGNTAANVLVGGGADDWLRGGQGTDTLTGGAGSDTADYGSDPGPAVGIYADLTDAGGYVADSWSLTDTVSGIENLVGTAYADFIQMGPDNNFVDAGAGNDLVETWDGSDTIFGGDGNDVLRGWNGNDIIDGGADQDEIVGGDGFDALSGGAGNDTLEGGEGDDALTGGQGDDSLVGGNGRDAALYLAAPSAVTVSLEFGYEGLDTGGAGIDWLYFDIEDLYGSAHADLLTGNFSANYLAGSGGKDSIAGRDNNDTIEGGADDDLLDGQNGTDEASYADATAAVNVSLLSYRSSGGAGNDILLNFEGVAGSAFNDTLTGNNGSNLLKGNGGNDALDGGGGDDSLAGGAGNDTLDGNIGRDTVVYEGLRNSYVVTATATGFTITHAVDGTDTLSRVELAQFADETVALVNNSFTDTQAPQVEAFDPGSGAIGVSTDATIVLSFSEVISSGTGTIRLVGQGRDFTWHPDDLDDPNDDTIGIWGNQIVINLKSSLNEGQVYTVSLGANAVKDAWGNALAGGNSFNFTTGGKYAQGSSNEKANVFGTAFGDTLVGGGYEDTLYGLEGNDFLQGRGRNDTLDGAGGTDTAVYDGADRAVVANLATGSSSGGPSGEDTFISIENIRGGPWADTLTGDTGPNALEGGEDNDSLSGGGGNDTLTGGLGDDSITGGEGTDTVVFSGPRAAYTVVAITGGYTVSNPFDGTDTVTGGESAQFLDQTLAFGDLFDTTAPTALSFFPTDEATGVAIGANVVVTFSEAIQRGAGSILLKTSGGAVVATYNAADSANLEVSGSTLTINPSADLGYSSGYTLEFTAGSIKDLSGNSYAGTNTYNFSTAAAPNTGQQINGKATADTLTGTTGDDTIDGLAGIDRVTFTGTRSQYTLTRVNDSTTTVADSVAGRNGTDTVRNAEFLYFSDANVDLGAAALARSIPPVTLRMIEELYAGFFNRIPDADGLRYWVQQYQGGMPITQIANLFYDSGVSLGIFSAGMSNPAFIGLIYANVLGRPPGSPTAPNAAEIGYWDQRLNQGLDSKGSMVVTMLTDVHNNLEGDPTYGFVVDLLANKSAVAEVFALDQGLTLNTLQGRVDVGNALAAPITPTDFAAALALVLANEFSAADPLAAPALLHARPADGEQTVSPAATLELVYSEPVWRATGMLQLRTAGGQLVEQFDIASSSRITLVGHTLRVDPSADLAAGSGYVLHVPQDAVRDFAGHGAAAAAIDFNTGTNGQTYPGGTGPDTVTGGPANDILRGLEHDDLLRGQGGNDTIDGGAGIDTVLFAGNRGEYVITRVSGGYTVADQVAGRDGTDTVVLNCEFLRFADMNVDFGVGALSTSIAPLDLRTLEELYSGFFNRTPDADGLRYWIGQLKAGMPMNDIADAFYDAGVGLGIFSAGMSNQAFISLMYGNVLGRPAGGPTAPSADDIQYWNNLLVTGVYTKGSMVTQMLSDVHQYLVGDATYGFVVDLLANKVEVASVFALEQGLTMNTLQGRVDFGNALAAAITPDDTSAAIALMGVNEFSALDVV